MRPGGQTVVAGAPEMCGKTPPDGWVPSAESPRLSRLRALVLTPERRRAVCSAPRPHS